MTTVLTFFVALAPLAINSSSFMWIRCSCFRASSCFLSQLTVHFSVQRCNLAQPEPVLPTFALAMEDVLLQLKECKAIYNRVVQRSRKTMTDNILIPFMVSALFSMLQFILENDAIKDKFDLEML